MFEDHIPETITKEYIMELYYNILDELIDQYEYDEWDTVPAYLEIKKIQPLGTADSKGVITISSNFIGTKEFDELQDTIRHELAHLYIGLHEGHNRWWKATARKFGAKPKSCQAVSLEMKKNIYKYFLIAEMPDGELIPIRPGNNRMKKYTSRTQTFSVRGVKVKQFHYADYAIWKDEKRIVA